MQLDNLKLINRKPFRKDCKNDGGIVGTDL